MNASCQCRAVSFKTPLPKPLAIYVGVGGEPISYSGLSYDSLLRQSPLPRQPLFETLLTPQLPRSATATNAASNPLPHSAAPPSSLLS
ncbi:hypothetical protein L207DRAFT_635844, partial [Hyaloscypha variabilis F]